MSKRSIYQQLRIPTDRFEQIQKFTASNQLGIYRGTMRAIARDLGYGNLTPVIDDPAVLNAIESWSSDVANSIIRTYNQMLQNELNRISSKLSDEAIRRALQPFLDSVATYNRTVLVPYTSAWTRQQATNDFYARNNLDATWSVEPPNTNQIDVCLDAIQASPMTTEEAMQYFFPAHQRCPHRLAPTRAPGATLPNVTDLFVGQSQALPIS